MPQGWVRCELKTPWRNGTMHVDFEPIDFIAKLAALVPSPRAHLTRFQGVMTPGILPCALRASLRLFPVAPGDWVNIDLITCIHCSGAARNVASIEGPGGHPRHTGPLRQK